MAVAGIFGIVLAGGEGKRLLPLTADRAKPAVPFGGNYRLIDFALSNLVNAGYLQDRRADAVQEPQPRPPHRDDLAALAAARQLRHAGAGADAARAALVRGLGRRDLPEPQPDLRRAARLRLRVRRRPHLPHGPAADGRAAPRDGRRRDGRRRSACRSTEASQFGVIETAADGQHDRGVPREAAGRRSGCPTRPDQVFASMGNYVFTTEALIDAVTRDARDDDSQHDLGGDIIPMLVERGEALRLRLRARTRCPGATERDRGYWRDVGTLDAYYDAHMDLISRRPGRSTSTTREWPILTWPEPLPPAKFVFEEPGRTGQALDSMVCAGVIVSGGACGRSILSPGVRVHSYAEVERLGAACTASTSAAAPSCATRSSTRTSAIAPTARRSASTPRPTASASPSPTGGVVVIGKGDDGRGLTLERRAAHARVPARRLRRRRRARRVPRARARAARRRDRPLLGRRARPRRRAARRSSRYRPWEALAGRAPHAGGARRRSRST